jgi:hypothetical protein
MHRARRVAVSPGLVELWAMRLRMAGFWVARLWGVRWAVRFWMVRWRVVRPVWAGMGRQAVARLRTV